MPPPSTVDSWLHGRRFGIVIDAGSSGSRLQIYSWRDPRLVRQEEGPKAYYSLSQVGKGTENPDDWVRKVEPGISSFAENPDDVAGHLAPLLDHAREHIPPSLHHETPIFLLATAGMRLLPPAQQDAVLNAACDFIRFHSHFKVEDVTASGHCGSSVRIISGEEEGLFGWIAVNYLMDQFTGNDDEPTTYGFLDMGGASTQIAFEPSVEERSKTKDLIDVRLRLIGGEDIHHQVFVTTWLGYGTNQARERYVGKTITENETVEGSTDAPIPDPCLPRNLQLVESVVLAGRDDEHDKNEHMLIGTGSFEQCLQRVAPLLNKDAPCPDVPCLFNGIHVPQIDFSASHFIGVSEYWYSSEHVFGLGGPYNFEEFERTASEFCSRDWEDIMRQHSSSKGIDTVDGDANLEWDERLIAENKWGDEVEITRLQMQCFKSAWIVNVLHDGIGMPRIVDPGGNLNEDSNDVKEKVDQKGLGKPTMQSLDSIGDRAISWTLGKMVLEASREVPPLSKDTRPLPEPIVDTHPKVTHGSADTDPYPSSISTSLPTEQSIELSHFVLFSYLTCFAMLSIIAFRLRHPILLFVRRYVKRITGKDLLGDNDLEEGMTYNSKGGRFSPAGLLFGFHLSHSNSRLLTNARSSLSRTLARLFRRPTNSTPSSLSSGRHMHVSASRASPGRSFSSPLLRNQTGSAGTLHYANSTFGASNSPRSSTPPSHRLDPSQPNGHSSPSLYSLPRSRNNSQMNLTMLVTRQPISRSGSSGQQTPTKIFFDGE
ncbi:YND1 [Sanghuangporus sanghuang]